MSVPLERHLLRAKDQIEARYAEPLDVAALASAAGLSPAHFSRLFKHAFGESPHGYLLTRRLERAAALLRNTDRSVADVCALVGLSSGGQLHDELQARVRCDADALPGGVGPGRHTSRSPERPARLTSR